MASIITHPVVPIAIAVALGSKLISPRLALAGALASIVPDLDSFAFDFGIPYAHAFGHRGFTHSLAFACAVGLLGAAWAPALKRARLTVFFFLLVATASHALLDAFTNGGLGVAALWPYSDQRFFAPVRVIEVSPIGIERFFSGHALSILRSEFIWVWLPAFALGAFGAGTRWFLCRSGSRGG